MFKNHIFRKSLPILAVVMSAIFWVADSVIDFYLLDEGESFFQALYAPEAVELWMRALVTAMMILFSIYARKLLSAQENIANELTIYKNNLELLVEQRTRKLEKVNVSLKEEIIQRKEIEKKLEHLATIDPLTLLHNRRKFDQLFDYEIEKDRRYQLGLSLIYCDIDNFKNINDTYGHDVGDEILITFATLLKKSLRESDIVARWGGEEFIVLIPSKTAVVAAKIAEKMRKSVEANEFANVGTVTASFGVTHYLNGDNKKTMIKRADEALYKAKENGRNRVEVLCDHFVV